MVSKKRRAPIPPTLAARVLFLSDRTCCVCRVKSKPVQIHHIDENPANNDLKNLAVLCFDCHTETQIHGGFHRKLDAEQLLLYRDDWLECVAKERASNRKQFPSIGLESDAELQTVESAVRAANPEDIIFHEIEIRLSDTWEKFLSWLVNETTGLELESVCEDTNRESTFYCSASPGHLNYYLSISGTVNGIRVTRSVDVIQEWLHPLAIQLGPATGGIPWDTSLFPIRDDRGVETLIDHPLASCRDCVYCVLFTK